MAPAIMCCTDCPASYWLSQRWASLPSRKIFLEGAQKAANSVRFGDRPDFFIEVLNPLLSCQGAAILPVMELGV